MQKLNNRHFNNLQNKVLFFGALIRRNAIIILVVNAIINMESFSPFP